MADRELWDKYFALMPDVAVGSASFYDQLEQLGKYAFSSQEPHLVITDVKSSRLSASSSFILHTTDPVN